MRPVKQALLLSECAMIELRWLVVEGVRKLQYRQKIDTTVRAGGPGTWNADNIAQTSNWQWSDWRDVPEVVDRDLGCP